MVRCSLVYPPNLGRFVVVSFVEKHWLVVTKQIGVGRGWLERHFNVSGGRRAESGYIVKIVTHYLVIQYFLI